MTSGRRSRLAIAVPERCERDGHCRRLHWTVGIATVERRSEALPDRLYRVWTHVGLLGTTMFLASWVVLAAVLVGLGLSRGLEATLLGATVTPTPPAASPSDLVAVVGLAAVAYVLYVAAFVVLAPGMLFHELGHAVAASRHGGTVESYGIVLVGPLPVGGFVRWRLDEQPAAHHARVQIATGGIANNLCWAGVLLCAAALVAIASGGLAGPPGAVDELSGPTAVVLVLGGLAALEVGTAWVNAVPLGGLDGAQYRDAIVRAVLRRWWGFDRVF